MKKYHFTLDLPFQSILSSHSFLEFLPFAFGNEKHSYALIFIVFLFT